MKPSVYCQNSQGYDYQFLIDLPTSMQVHPALAGLKNKQMKKIFYIVVCIVTALTQTCIAQDIIMAPEILTQYYAVKDALVNGNPAKASSAAEGFITIINSSEAKILPETDRSSFLKDATSISKTKDLKKQREYFSAFSDHMATLAKKAKFNTAPVYIAYCPMKKASWLSNSSAIKNPYYGSSMLTCGKVAEILK